MGGVLVVSVACEQPGRGEGEEGRGRGEEGGGRGEKGEDVGRGRSVRSSPFAP